MRVLGVDPGLTRCGLGVVDGSGGRQVRCVAVDVVRRTRRVELWNGNHEPPLHTIFTDPEHVVRWAWGSYARIGPRVQDVLAQPDHPAVVRLRSVGRSGGGSLSWPDLVEPDVVGI